MTDADLVIAAKERLTELAQRALQMHRTAGTRHYIIRIHNYWNEALAAHNCDHQPLSPDKVAAFLKLDETTAKFASERGHDPDSILNWLDMFPSIVMSVYLEAKTPHTV